MNENNYFLATTALEEYWDTTKPILFLGEWCRLYSRRDYWSKLEGKLLENNFDTIDKGIEAYSYVMKIYKNLLPIIGDALNQFHKTKFSVRYWQIVIGPWLMQYISVIYDRYRYLNNALEHYPNLSTIVLSKNSYATAANTLDFVVRLDDDLFNLQLYSNLLRFLGKNFQEVDLQNKQKISSLKVVKAPWKTRLLEYFSKKIANIGFKDLSSVVLVNSYFSKAVELDLLLKSRGKIFPVKGPVRHSFFRFNATVREKITDTPFGKSELEKYLSEFWSTDIPTCFVEGFDSIRADATKAFPHKVKAIMSANSWYRNEDFKFWAAECAERGVKLIGTQHGADYGSLAIEPSENHETSIVDYYYSWGWHRDDCNAEVVPMPATKMVGRKKVASIKNNAGILWALTTRQRYLLEFPSTVKSFQNYLEWQSRFAVALNDDIISRIRIRPHCQDSGWGIAQRIQSLVPQLKTEDWNIPFIDSLSNCKLYVCDHLSTTFSEALIMNKPTLLFWSPEVYKLRATAKPYYDLLRKHKILCDTPEEAAKMVNDIYVDVHSWWNDKVLQESVSEFRDHFIKTAPNAVDLWSRELQKQAPR